ncbi:IQ-domain 17 [Striga hermonthica]|uniref:IQ-domain 17 n=1 Tax=Striga hermonthica TaxID=68872 RepID=A0A9N7MJQ2_STRHE|nr:IQ-domain 17 [Striga hermonthica]
MGKNSWLTAVKRAFRSPTKDSPEQKRSTSRRKVDNHQQQRRRQQQQEEDEKKTERRRWVFKRQSNNDYHHHHHHHHHQPVEPIEQTNTARPAEQRHAIAVAEAAVATAKAGVEIIRLTQQPTLLKLQCAARVIQTAFRGYLARRALIALKGIVKLQALIRGQNVRKQATLTMRYMKTLLRVQARMRDQRARLSHEGARRSMFAETRNIWESNYTKDMKSRSRDGSCVTDDWRDCPRTLEELEAILKARNEAALVLHDYKSLPFAFSQQQNKILDSDSENRAKWLDKWMSARQQPPWEYPSRPSTEYRRASTVEIDSHRKSRCQSPIRQSRPTKSPPIRAKEDKCQSAANTPSLRSAVSVPNYMAATESAKARVRWQSAPRHRPERERSARKRLSYPMPDPNFGLGKNLRSPSFKSVHAGYVGMEEQESVGGEISPCSTTDLRRWLR